MRALQDREFCMFVLEAAIEFRGRTWTVIR